MMGPMELGLAQPMSTPTCSRPWSADLHAGPTSHQDPHLNGSLIETPNDKNALILTLTKSIFPPPQRHKQGKREKRSKKTLATEKDGNCKNRSFRRRLFGV